MAGADIPIGLQQLTAVDRVCVKQKTTMLANKYVVTNASGQVMFTAKEDSSALGLMFGGNNRHFNMDLLDTQNQKVITLRRPYCVGTSKLQVSVCGELASVVRQELTFVKPVLCVNDPWDRPVLRVKGPAVYNCTCDFDVLTLEKQRIGVITKIWGGLLRETFTNSDNFQIKFPIDLDVRYKAALIGTALLIDYLYYEKGS